MSTRTCEAVIVDATARAAAIGLTDPSRAGFQHGVHVKTHAAHERRTLLEARGAVVAGRQRRDRHECRNDMCWLLETSGPVLVLDPEPEDSGGRFATLVEAASCTNPSLRIAIEPSLAVERPPELPLWRHEKVTSSARL